MALGKLWNAIFGKSAAVDKGLPPASDTLRVSQQPVSSTPASRLATVATEPSAPTAMQGSATTQPEQTGAKSVTKVKRKSVAKAKKTPTPAADTIATEPVQVPQRRMLQIARPQQNAWTKWLTGRSIGSILDTRLGDGTRAIEVLQAIVCDSVPTPKYIAIDLFDLGSGRLTLMEFHQRIRRAGGHPVAIPAALPNGLRQLSQTHGTVDLVLLEGSEVELAGLEFRRLLARVTHSDTLVLHRDERGNWQSIPPMTAATKRPGASATQAA